MMYERRATSRGGPRPASRMNSIPTRLLIAVILLAAYPLGAFYLAFRVPVTILAT